MTDAGEQQRTTSVAIDPRGPSPEHRVRQTLPGVSVCFPAYNEEATVGDVLQEAHELLAPSGLDYEILVCNDGSSDRTGEIIHTLAARLPRLRVLDHPRNLGIRASFEDLYRAATKEFVFLNSTDRQWKTALLFEMLPLAAEWDMIVSSRVDKRYGPMRALISWGFNFVPRLLFGVRTYDAGGVKLVRREIIERFPVISVSPFSEAERIIRATRAGYRVTSHAAEVSTRRTGRARGVSLRLVTSAAKDVARLWWDLRR